PPGRTPLPLHDALPIWGACQPRPQAAAYVDIRLQPALRIRLEAHGMLRPRLHHVVHVGAEADDALARLLAHGHLDGEKGHVLDRSAEHTSELQSREKLV